MAKPAAETEPALVLCQYLRFGNHTAAATRAEKHITARLMRLIYFPHERRGRNVSGADFHSVDPRRRRLGSSTCRWKRALLLAPTSRWSSPRQRQCRLVLVPATGARLTPSALRRTVRQHSSTRWYRTRRILGQAPREPALDRREFRGVEITRLRHGGLDGGQAAPL